MKDSDQDSKRIPKEQMTAWERWELPLLDERGNQVVEEEEVKPLTARTVFRRAGRLVTRKALSRVAQTGTKMATPQARRRVGARVSSRQRSRRVRKLPPGWNGWSI
ncbi:Flagellar assembly protein FliH(fragment) [Marinobacter nauticus ATCC 49840]